MASSSNELGAAAVARIYLGTTDEESWHKYGFSDSSVVSEKPVARKKVKKEEEKEKEEELVDNLQGMVIDKKPFSDLAQSSEPFPAAQSSDQAFASCGS